jgi:hypothetical protein
MRLPRASSTPRRALPARPTTAAARGLQTCGRRQAWRGGRKPQPGGGDGARRAWCSSAPQQHVEGHSRGGPVVTQTPAATVAGSAARSAEVRSRRGQRACRGLLHEAGMCGWRGGKPRQRRALGCCAGGASCPAQARLAVAEPPPRPGHAQPLMSAWEHSTRDAPGAGGLAWRLSLARRCTGSNLQRCSATQPSTGARAVTSRDLSQISVDSGCRACC